MQCVIIGIIAARPGCIRIRVSREISFGPNTKPASRVSESREAAASASACKTARAVSIIAHTRIEMSALMSLRRLAIAVRSSTLETFGTRMPSGRALPAMVTSSIHHGESSALTRIRISRLPKPPLAMACAIWSRAIALASGATESSRSRMMPSAGRLRAFSSARAFDPGMNNRLRRGRIMGKVPLGRSWVDLGTILGLTPYHLSLGSESLVRVTGIWLGKDHGTLPATSARRLPDLCDAAAADRADALPRTVRARPVAGGDGDRLLRLRVSPEVIFDAGPGELFVVRNV